MLKTLKINKYPLVQPGTTLRFNRGLNVLLGKNGTGKTTFLNLIAMVMNTNFGDLQAEEFDLEYELEADEGPCFVRARNRKDEHADTDPVMQRWPAAAKFVYEFEIEAFIKKTNRSVTIRVTRGRATLEQTGQVVDLGNVSPFTPRLHFVLYVFKLLKLFSKEHLRLFEYLGDLGLVSRFDEATSFVHDVLGAAKFNLVLNEKLQACVARDLQAIPYDFFALFMKRYHKAPPDSDSLSFNDSEFVFLQEATRALGFSHTTMNLDLLNQELVDEGIVRKEYGSPRFYFISQDGARIPFQRLSFGQKRLFGFFYHLALHPEIAIADELANGMHHSMITDCLQAIGTRQAFLATQNPLLLDHLNFSDSEEVRSTFVLCEAQEGRARWRWSHLTPDAAEEFFRDYQVGIQHTNDILRTRGLW